MLNRIFFPEDSDAAGILKSMMVLGVAYVVRPFGAMIMDPLGDKFGSLLATAVFVPFAALPEDQLLSWGWRVPFWLSAIVVVVAWIIRRRLEEAPTFTQTHAQQTVGKRRSAPLAQVFTNRYIAIITVAVCAMVNTVNMVFTTFSISFATKGHGIDAGVMLWVPIASNGLSLLAIPLWAALADRVGRKPIFITGTLVAGGLMFPYLHAIVEGNILLVFVFGVLMHGAFYSMANGIWPSFYTEMFPTSVRVTGLALGTQIGFALSGGIAPAAATALAGDDFSNWVGPAVFVLAMTVLAALVASTARETGKMTLAQVDAAHR